MICDLNHQRIFSDVFSDDFDSKISLKVKSAGPHSTVSYTVLNINFGILQINLLDEKLCLDSHHQHRASRQGQQVQP